MGTALDPVVLRCWCDEDEDICEQALTSHSTHLVVVSGLKLQCGIAQVGYAVARPCILYEPSGSKSSYTFLCGFADLFGGMAIEFGGMAIEVGSVNLAQPCFTHSLCIFLASICSHFELDQALSFEASRAQQC